MSVIKIIQHVMLSNVVLLYCHLLQFPLGLVRQSKIYHKFCTEIREVNLSPFVYRKFHEDFASLIKTDIFCSDE